MTVIDILVDQEVRGSQNENLYNGWVYEEYTHLTPDRDDGADMSVILVSRGYPGGEGYETIEQLVNGEVKGHQGGSLEGYTPVSYRNGRPGFGGFNDQPMQSSVTNMGGQSVPSQEAGTGKPWGPIAHMPVAEGANPTRANYAYQGMFMDGQQPILDGKLETRQRNNGSRRAPLWIDALFNHQQDPNNKRISQWVGSTVMEVPTTMSLSEALGRFTDNNGPSWGLQ